MHYTEIIPYITMGLGSLLTVLVTAGLYKLERKSKTFQGLSYMKGQVVIGVVFGLLSVAGTEFGMDIDGAIINFRDAAPVCAGLIFGGPAGIIAGCIGGLERWFAVYWGAGELTRLACSLGTICAGAFAAFVRKFLMENKMPGCMNAFFTGMVAEVFHMLLVFMTNISDVQSAFEVVKATAPFMIVFNSVTVAVVVIVVTLISGDGSAYSSGQRKIVQEIQGSLFVVVVISFALANAFVYLINTNIARNGAEFEMYHELVDVQRDITTELMEGTDFEGSVGHAIENGRICSTGCIVLFEPDGDVVNYSSNTTEGIRESLTNMFYEVTSYAERDCIKKTVAGEECFVEYIKVGSDYMIATYPLKEAYVNRDTTILITNFLMVEIMAALFAGIYIFIRTIVVDSIKKINAKLGKIAAGDLDVTVDVKSNEEFESLSNDINSTVDTLKHYIDEAESRMQQELEFAKNIQASALSKDFPSSRYFEIYATMKPAREVGGDFYDFYRIGRDKCVFLVADVSGKGIPAAMFMMKAKTLLKSLVETGAEVDTVFTKANEELCKGNEADMFVTSWMGIMDLKTGIIRFANAGHNPPVIRRRDGSAEFVKSRPAFVLAGMEGIKYRVNEVKLNKGDCIYLYTDGVTEATNNENDFYGDERLLDIIKQSDNMKPRELCAFVKEDVGKFAGGAAQFDDITMLALRFREDKEDESEIYLVPNNDSITLVQEFMDDRMQNLDVPAKTAARMGIIVDEVYSNITQYSGATIARVKCSLGDGNLLLQTEDNGIEYNPLERETPDISLPIEEREVGGLGIHMVTHMCKDVTYIRKNGRNILTMLIEIK